MTPNFDALQVIAEIALGLVGFSAILIGLSRTSEGFSAPDNYRVQLLTHSAFGTMFCWLIPFEIFDKNHHKISWTITLWLICLYSVVGLLVFSQRMSVRKRSGHKTIFPWQIYVFQTRMLSLFIHDQQLYLEKSGHLRRMTTSIFTPKFGCLCKEDVCSSGLSHVSL